MKRMILTTIAIVTGLMLLSFVVIAQPGDCDYGFGKKMHSVGGHGQSGHGQMGLGMKGHGMKGDRMGHLLKMAEELDLTDAQIDQIKKIRTDFQLRMVDARAELQKAQIGLNSLKHDAEASQLSVFAAIDNLSEKQAEMNKMQYAHRQEIHAVLTPEQQERAKALKKGHGQCGMGHGQFDDDDDDHDDD